MKKFEYSEVESSNIKAIGYNAEDGLLEITFHSDEIYWYIGVPIDIVKQLISAESVGKAFNELIKKAGYAYLKVTEMREDSILDGILIANLMNMGTPRYMRLSMLADEILHRDYMEIWDIALYRTQWLEYQTDDYREAVRYYAKELAVLPISQWHDQIKEWFFSSEISNIEPDSGIFASQPEENDKN